MSTTRRWLPDCCSAFAVFVATIPPVAVLATGCNNPLLDSLLGGLLGGGSGLSIVTPSLPVRTGEDRQIEVTSSGNVSTGDIVSWHVSGTGGTISQDGLFSAASMGQVTIWATYRIPAQDPNNPPISTTTNKVTFDIWPHGPKSGS